jgi:hypothetical protein
VKRIYTASHLPDAHIVANLLRHSGIAVQIFNVNASGAFGELPLESSLPQVWLENEKDEARANEIIGNYQHTAVSNIVRPCSHCGEENPLAFETCWSCGKAV